jgi:glycosyltransferase involved in cell wall biosynthesis
MRTRGVAIHFTVYDLLPMLRPDVFPFGTEQYFGDFLRTVHAGVRRRRASRAPWPTSWPAGTKRRACAAGAAAAGLVPPGRGHRRQRAEHRPAARRPRRAGRPAARPSFLMVGTVEPRKGQAQALAAFEQLWERGVDVNLVIVGKKAGWSSSSPRAWPIASGKGQALFWLAGISDEMLLKLYAGSAALLAASEGEGFGLPLIEAAQHGIPIIARSLPVFREVAGDHAYYFDGLAPADLARAIEDWLALQRAGKAPASTGMPWLTWDRSARQSRCQRAHRTLPGTDA